MAGFEFWGGVLMARVFAVTARSVSSDWRIQGLRHCRVGFRMGGDPLCQASSRKRWKVWSKKDCARPVPGDGPEGTEYDDCVDGKVEVGVYPILNRDAAANLTISPPLEAHKSNAIIHRIVRVDVGFENPMYAALEVDYSESDQDRTGEALNRTEKVPGGQLASSDRYDGPSGVLVCCEDHIIYRHMNSPQPVFLSPAANTLWKGAFFFLLQSEDGDLFKVTIEHQEQDVTALKIKILRHYEMQSLDSIIDSKVLNILPNSDTPQIFIACGRGARIKSYDSYIILSFVNGTLVLSIGETIGEVQDTGFLCSSPTIAVQQIGVDALLQVHPHDIRRVLLDRSVNEWRVPEGKTMIVTATTNKRQVVVALSIAELVYFELDLDGPLNEYQDRKAMGSTVLALSIGEVPEGRQTTPYLAVGCEVQTVRIISLDPESALETLSLQALTSQPSSISIADMLDASIYNPHPTMFANIGLQNGVLLRTVLDPMNGQLTDTRTRFLGTRPIKLV
ncbi:hypothetical protein DFP72DRAFT_859615 [Ephemerocybe angulata]|uniref:Cleavage/polyadenylation specificity factor A subunit N-terminal domain-containing protein n=1 Tax=Ephemerocybe angulata TaxID=980116 RepID=A0A8H6H9R8_9AGAR|nr:hypothetical protein DFP72DRAFT_859615 [Tulosesus angulatus]